ncbi:MULTISPECIES: Crp/Fnr family transcriptional regulator [Niastella]|uniref:Crp/Fnr family transcriptional regulator n=1 Tax=Niastella soli TaxID=2821487 RepID=A0ABS3YPK1_9BACT|nr:Crp/Fnr family transcriptional regulator [Niastella soli]MBO9199390.1 Crp/Fnr family transcriptional regulator [Niastella soli]
MPYNSCDLTSCFLCKYCISEWKELIAIKKKTLQLKKGTLIFKEGNPVEGIFFITSGTIKVHKQWGEQRELIVRFAKAGDVLGHRGFGATHVFPVSATCLEDSKVCYIPNSFLEATLKTNPAFTYRLLQVYATELQNAEKRMRDLALMEVKSRVAQALLEIATLFGTDTEQYISIPISRQDIASYAGTTYETVFKLFTNLVAEDIITSTGKRIKINNSIALQKLVNEPNIE